MMPFNEILIALRAELADALATTVINGLPVTVRSYRHRESKTEERPCVAIRYMSNDVSPRVGRQETSAGMPEVVMELAVDLVIDMDLPEEEDDPASIEGDPTGFGDHAAVLAVILDRLMPGPDVNDGEPNTLGGRLWDVAYDGTSPDEGDATPDAARMEERLVLLYRVRADQPTVLLRS